MTVVKDAKSKLLVKRATIYLFRRIFAWRRILFVARVAFDLRFFSRDEREGWKIVYREENFWYFINNRYIIPARDAVTARIALLVYRYINVYVYVTGWIGRVERSGQGLLALAPAGMVTTVIDWYECGARWNGKETKRKKGRERGCLSSQIFSLRNVVRANRRKGGKGRSNRQYTQ